jgi:cytochrome P450
MSPLGCQPLWREVESSGAVIDGHFIPPGVNVGAGMYRLHHNEQVFPDPWEYNIERWVTRDNGIEEKERVRELQKCFAPFSAGPRICIAKNFAVMELLLAMANVVWKMEFDRVGSLGEGQPGMGEGRERKGEFQLRSFFTSRMNVGIVVNLWKWLISGDRAL